MKSKISMKFGFMLMLALLTIANAQSNSIGFKSGITVAIKTETVPPGNTDSLGSIYGYTDSSDNIVHRMMTDTKNKIYFGYDVVVEKQDETGKFKVSIKPLSKTPKQLLNRNITSGGNIPDYDTFTAKSLAKYPEAVILDDGDTITLDILENPQTRTKISDIIKVMSKPSKFISDFSERRDAKDFTIDDVLLKMTKPEISINDKTYKTGTSLMGNINWIYIQGKGRFIFSFSPQPGYNFQKTGIILDNKIMFDFNGDKYKIISQTPILGEGGKWNLWVMYDPDYHSTFDISPESPFHFGAASKIEYLFNKK